MSAFSSRPGRANLGWLLLLCIVVPARHAASADWQPLAILRIGGFDAIDAEDGDIAAFVRSIRNDGRFIPPVRTLVGPAIRNPTFYGVGYEAWLECALMIPVGAGSPESVWLFPVDNRDEYMAQLASQGLSEYEGMDGVTNLRETTADGNVRSWCMEWLPGNVALFGRTPGAVADARRVYAENAASRGLLSGAEGRYLEPDISLRVDLPRLAAWQDSEFGVYWWRTNVELLAQDLVAYWQPSPARERLLRGVAETLIAWPRGVGYSRLDVWFEKNGVEWRVDVAGGLAPRSPSFLDAMRRLPERAAMAYGVPVTRESASVHLDWLGSLFVRAAGGAVSREARSAALELKESLLAGNPREYVAAWVPPPAGSPELGGARLLLARWDDVESLSVFWDRLLTVLRSGAVLSTLEQVGWRVSVDADPERGVADVAVFSAAAEEGAEPYCHGTFSMRKNDGILALVGGESGSDPETRNRIMAYRAQLAEEAVAATGPGGPDVREAFTRVGPEGAGFMAILEPVRLLQFCLVEAADWRPRSPDQHEPESTQMAREMLEYGVGRGRAWTVAGESRDNAWRFTGFIPWQSLARLSAALGLTESIAMEP